MSKPKRLLPILTVAVGALAAAGYLGAPGKAHGDPGGNPIAILHTSAGDITMVLRADAAPKSVARFIDHAQRGVYDGVVFEGVTPWTIRAGAVLPDGSLSGANGYQYEDRETYSPLENVAGNVGLVDYGGTCDSHEFYVCLSDIHRLDGTTSVFAEVQSGMEILRNIQAGGADDGWPANIVTINSVEIAKQ